KDVDRRSFFNLFAESLRWSVDDTDAHIGVLGFKGGEHFTQDIFETVCCCNGERFRLRQSASGSRQPYGKKNRKKHQKPSHAFGFHVVLDLEVELILDVDTIFNQ